MPKWIYLGDTKYEIKDAEELQIVRMVYNKYKSKTSRDVRNRITFLFRPNSFIAKNPITYFADLRAIAEVTACACTCSMLAPVFSASCAQLRSAR